MEPFEEASKTPNPLVNPKLIPTIFAYIDDLIKLSNELVKSMRFSPFPSSNNLQYIYNNHRLGQTFLRYYKDFDIYQKYAKNHRKSRNAIKKANKNVLYRKFVQRDSLKIDLCNKMNGKASTNDNLWDCASLVCWKQVLRGPS
ncbi:6699_t:CDS:2 [Entrophospora sp. SA101]|nr:6699_t:CDS:2 [Entrophospora sp. SA101]